MRRLIPDSFQNEPKQHGFHRLFRAVISLNLNADLNKQYVKQGQVQSHEGGLGTAGLRLSRDCRAHGEDIAYASRTLNDSKNLNTAVHTT